MTGKQAVTTREQAPITTEPHQDAPEFNAAEIGAIAHLYRDEMYRSKIWRTSLDATTNWAVVTTGIAMSIAFSKPTPRCCRSSSFRSWSPSGCPKRAVTALRHLAHARAHAGGQLLCPAAARPGRA
jgi:hypothetical protein